MLPGPTRPSKARAQMDGGLRDGGRVGYKACQNTIILTANMHVLLIEDV